MSALASFPFFSLLLVWLSGTVLGLTYPISRIKNLLIWAIIICSLLYVCLLIMQEKYGIAHRCWLGFLAFVLLLLMSYGNIWLDVAYRKKTHFTTWLKNNNTEKLYNKPIVYCVTIDKVYQTKNPFTACKVSVTHIQNNKSWYVTTGTLCMYFSNKLTYQPKTGDLLLIRGSPTERQPNTYNPSKETNHNDTAQYKDTVNLCTGFYLDNTTITPLENRCTTMDHSKNWETLTKSIFYGLHAGTIFWPQKSNGPCVNQNLFGYGQHTYIVCFWFACKHDVLDNTYYFEEYIMPYRTTEATFISISMFAVVVCCIVWLCSTHISCYYYGFFL